MTRRRAMRWNSGGRAGGGRLLPSSSAFALVCALLFSFGSQGDAMAAEISYLVEVVDPASHLARLSVSLRGFSSPSLNLVLSRDIAIGKLEASFGGAPLTIARSGERFALALGEGGNADVRYELTMAQYMDYPGRGPRGYLCPGYMLGSVEWSLMVPEGEAVALCRVRFSLPEGWRAVAPWSEAGEGFEETDIEAFRGSTYAAGAFEERVREIGGSAVRVAVDMRHDQAFRETLFDQSFRIFGFMKGLFGAPGPARHLSVFVKPEGPGEWQFANEHGLSQGEAVSDARNAAYQYAHRVFHTFNAFYPEGMRLVPTWFMEGANEYYCRLAMAVVRAEYPLEGLREIYEGTYLPARALYDAPLSGDLRDPGSYAREDFLAYKKAALVAALLDAEIGRATGGSKSLADLLRDLYARHGRHRGGVLDEEAIEAGASFVAGRDMKPFFDAHIRSVSPLAMDGLFLDADLDGVSAIGEAWLGTDAGAADSDGDGASDACEYWAGTDPRNPAARPEGRVLVDGFDTEWGMEGERGGGALRAFVDGGHLYLRLGFPETEGLARGRAIGRWYVNVDVDGDGEPELHFGAMPSYPGDASKFGEAYATYDFRLMGRDGGLASAVARIAEFRLPLGLLGPAPSVRIWAGIWDTRAGRALSSVECMDLALPRARQ